MARVPVFTESLGRLTQSTAGGYLIGKTPIGWRWVLRDLVLTQSSGATARITLYIQHGSVLHVLYDADLGDAFTTHVDLRQVMDGNDELSVLCAGAPFSVLATGYAFSLA